MSWMPLFNKDHKASFRVGGSSSWSPVSVDILLECGALPKSEIIQHKIWDDNYDYDLLFPKNKTPKDSRTFWNRKLSSIEKRINNAKLKKQFCYINYLMAILLIKQQDMVLLHKSR